MELDISGKNFMAMIDNGDGTCTSIICIPEVGFEETSIIEMGFADVVSGAVNVALSNPEMMEEFIDKSTEIPNDLEGLE